MAVQASQPHSEIRASVRSALQHWLIARSGLCRFGATFLLGPGLVAAFAGFLSVRPLGVAAAIGISYLVLGASEIGAAAWLERFGLR